MPDTAATDATPMLRGSRDHRRSLAATASAALRSVVYVGFTSASANAFALSKRSAGIFSSAFATAAATFGGTALRSFVTGAASSVTIFMMICCADAPVCGGSPVSISYSTQPSE